LASNSAVPEVVGGPNPVGRVVGNVGEGDERESQPLGLGGELFDLSFLVMQAGLVEEGVILAQEVDTIEEDVVVPTSRRRWNDQDLPGAVRGDPHPPQGFPDQAAS